MSVDKNQCANYHIDLTGGSTDLINLSCHIVHSNGYLANINHVDDTHRRWTTWSPWPNHMDYRKSGGHSDFTDPNDPFPISVALSTMILTLLMC